MPTRRAHSKSRRGCTPCKTRHLKCNEARPVCSRCRDVDRECSYPTRTLARHQGADQQVSLSTGGLASSDSYGLALSITTSTGGTSAEVGDQGDIYTIRHIRLLDNFDSVVLSGADPAGQQQRKAYMEIALEFPFLLNQMLALSAAHMSVSNTTSGAADATEATFLQTRALEQFNRFQSTPRETTSEQQRIAVFLYSSLLSMHVLFDALASSESGEPDSLNYTN
ncbi:hypothetical protein NW762_001505 [Fusarium torreyae]|uniref:Zn(2)-C6 fungal-type domain-containing protein n=1 Tax=Fusarium torreyae TaxID=1237075 RepID=A0A9W8SEU5_9HYPO|nr:hypothetical protein NW762_001505 [Fusarium torreyae]